MIENENKFFSKNEFFDNVDSRKTKNDVMIDNENINFSTNENADNVYALKKKMKS